jgi:hypothetical protein
MARAHALREFRLGQPKIHSVLDDEPSDLLVRTKARLLLAVSSTAASTATSSFRDRSSSWTVAARHVESHLTKIDKQVKTSRSVVAGGPWSTAAVGVHPGLEVVPSLLCQVDFALRDLASVLAEDVQKYDQIPRATIEHSVELGTVVAAELAQFAFDLRTVGETEGVGSTG